MNRLLLLMTTRTWRAGAFLSGAANAGVPVIVASDQTQALAHANPEGHITLEFARVEASVDAIDRVSATVPIGAVIGTDDEAVVLAAHAAKRLGLRHAALSAVTTLRDKGRMRVALRGSGVPSPSSREFDTRANLHEESGLAPYPCVLKPVSLSASRGVIRVDNPEQFVAAARRIESILGAGQDGGIPEQRILVESFLPGSEVALEGIFHEGRLRTLAIFDKPDPLDGPFFEESLYITPSRHAMDLQETLIRRVEQAAAAVHLDEGPIHAEARLHGGDAWLLEAAPRSIGGLCSRALRFANGASLEEVIIRQAMGLPVVSWERESQASGVLMIPVPFAGVLGSVEGVAGARGVPGIEDVVITAVIGQRLIPPPEGDRYPGFVFARGETPGLVESSLREAHRLIRFVRGGGGEAGGVAPDPVIPQPVQSPLDRC